MLGRARSGSDHGGPVWTGPDGEAVPPPHTTAVLRPSGQQKTARGEQEVRRLLIQKKNRKVEVRIAES